MVPLLIKSAVICSGCDQVYFTRFFVVIYNDPGKKFTLVFLVKLLYFL